MNNAEAKRYVCRVIGWTILTHLSHGAEYLSENADNPDDELSPEDCGRVQAAAHALAKELFRRGGKP